MELQATVLKEGPEDNAKNVLKSQSFGAIKFEKRANLSGNRIGSGGASALSHAQNSVNLLFIEAFENFEPTFCWASRLLERSI